MIEQLDLAEGRLKPFRKPYLNLFWWGIDRAAHCRFSMIKEGVSPRASRGQQDGYYR